MCCVAGAYNVGSAPQVILDMMSAQYHRGGQGSGVALFGADNYILVRTEEMMEVLRKNVPLDLENIFSGIGHLRYGTTGERDATINIQPFSGETRWGRIFIGHNGATPSFEEMKNELKQKGATFVTTSDTEPILHYINQAEGGTLMEALKNGLSKYQGAYSLVMALYNGSDVKIIAARDPHGIRPLALGKRGDGYLVASEDVAFENVSAKYIRDIEPGEVIIISEEGIQSGFMESKKKAHCIFENIYFSFPTSDIFGISVEDFREGLGLALANRYGHHIKYADVVTNLPDSSNPILKGFCKSKNIYPESVFYRFHKAPRSFTQPHKEARYDAVRKKFSISKKIERRLKGRRVWVIDDSIVRGNTSRRVVRALKKRGASFVGFLSASPPIIGPCRKGIDLEGRLIAGEYIDSSGKPCIDKIREEIEADALYYLPYQDIRDLLRTGFKTSPDNFCFGCFNGNEPVWNKWNSVHELKLIEKPPQ